VALSFLGKWFGGGRGTAPALAEVRTELDRLAAERPAFAAPVKWLRQLLDDLAPLTSPVPGLILDPTRAREKLASGVPLLRDERVPVDGKAFRKRWQRACAALQSVNPEASAAALADAVKRKRLDPEALVGALVAGRPEIVHRRAEELSLDPTLAASLLRFALFPHFTALAASLSSLRDGTAWERGYCPTCGSWPLLGEFRGLDQSRFLRCGLCGDEWQVSHLRCPFCDCRDHERLSFLHVEGEEGKWRAAVCDQCRGYVKMVATLSALPPLALLVADVTTLHLDLAAAERGYTQGP